MRNELYPWGLTALANDCANPFIWRPAIRETWVATRAPCVASIYIIGEGSGAKEIDGAQRVPGSGTKIENAKTKAGQTTTSSVSESTPT